MYVYVYVYEYVFMGTHAYKHMCLYAIPCLQVLLLVMSELHWL